MKGQVEFIAVFAFIVIAVVVILVSFGGFVAEEDRPIVTGLGEEKKLIKDSILNSIRDSGKKELREIYRTGGISNSENTVRYGVKEIGIWGDCDRTEIPKIEKILEKDLEERIKVVFKPEMEFFGKGVSIDLGNLDVFVSIQDNGVKIDVNMPTFVENSSIPQPYSILIPSKLKEIIEVSEDITNRNNNSKFLESATLNTILYSNPEEEWLPTIDLRTGCRNTLFKTESEVRNSLENLVKYTASHTVFNRDVLDLPENPFYLLGVADSDLQVSFVYPEDWNLGNNFDIEPNPVVFYPKPVISFSSTCIETMDVRYSFRYPIIVMIEDDVFDQLFNFAIMVNIDENEPGCGFRKGEKTSYHEKCVMESGCLASVNVRDSKGLPVSKALVTFGGCSLGETDYLGLLNSGIPCMIGEISIHKEGYREHRKLLKASNLEGYSVVLEGGGKEIPVHFYGVPVKPGDPKAGGTYKDYSVSGQPRSINLFSEDYFVLVYIKPEDGDNIMLYNIGSEGFIGETKMILKPGVYDVFGAIVNNQTSETVGYVETVYLSTGDENEIYIYLPFVEGISESIKPSEIYKIEIALGECGIEVVSEGEQSVSVPCG